MPLVGNLNQYRAVKIPQRNALFSLQLEPCIIMETINNTELKGTGKPETEDTVPTIRMTPTPKRGTHVLPIIDPAAAADYAVRPRSGSCRIGLDVLTIVIRPVPAPFPCVPVHVI